MAPAKRLKRSGSKATIDHVSGSTGRDGAFDFASKAEILERMTGPTMTGGPNRKAEGFKQKSELCAQLAASATEAGVRLSYEELSHRWRELADEAEKLEAARNHNQ